MRGATKTSQLQLRVSPGEKAALKRYARRAGVSLSEWILGLALPPLREEFQRLLEELGRAGGPGYALAELNDLLARLTRSEFELAVSEAPRVRLDPYRRNYLAAMVEHAAAQRRAPAPAWTAEIEPLERPVFGSSLRSLRMHLLTHAPVAFRRRNIFVDSSVGDRV